MRLASVVGNMMNPCAFEFESLEAWKNPPADETAALTPEIQELVDHAHQIAQEHQIRLHLSPTHPLYDARATKSVMRGIFGSTRDVCRFVVARTIQDERTYAVVMHEIGHLLSPNGFYRFDKYDIRSNELPPGTAARQVVEWEQMKLLEEQDAWDWAMAHVLRWTPTMERVRQYAFGTYLESSRWAQDMLQQQEKEKEQ